jgi:hypothetical protein
VSLLLILVIGYFATRWLDEPVVRLANRFGAWVAGNPAPEPPVVPEHVEHKTEAVAPLSPGAFRWTMLGALGAIAILGTLLLHRDAKAFAPEPVQTEPTFKASSAWGSFLTTGVLGHRSGKEDLLFHTEEEAEPSVIVELHRAMTVRRVVVTNSTDCCSERVIPLAIDVKTGPNAWKTVAQNDGNFVTWEAEFAPTTTRAVRLHVPRRTMLHLYDIRIE